MKVCNKTPRRIVRKIVLIAVLIAVLIGVFMLPRFVSCEMGEVYSEFIFPVIAMPGNIISGIVQTSLTETVVVAGSVALIAFALVFIVTLIKKALTKGALLYLYKVLRAVLIIAIILSLTFVLMHGLNYRRYPASKLLKLTGGEYTFEDYESALSWAYLGMVSARAELGTDYNGVAHMNNSFENNVSYANVLVNDVLARYDIRFNTTNIRCKPVSLSHYWSMLGITGAYDPFLGEANINTDYMDITSFPITICHEILHAKGFARETDCNLLAAICCIRSSRPDFRYAGYYEIFWSLLPVVSEYAANEGRTLYPYQTDRPMYDVYMDIRASSVYWDGIEDETKRIFDMLGIDLLEAGEEANNAFLEANGQEGGTETYTVPYSIYVDFYKTYVEAKDA
ncbi:MAG: DUF3810 domain-containing protein [Saccharofermentans sp.]|nr:DUF3810 domain-containing protein [Saccharofermentans sp.]